MDVRKNRNRKNAQEETQQERPGLAKLFEVPQNALSGVAQIEIAGNREAVIDGCQGILEYDENVIKLSAGRMSIRFSGRGLQIKVLTHDSAVVEGFITGIEFIT